VKISITSELKLSDSPGATLHLRGDRGGVGWNHHYGEQTINRLTGVLFQLTRVLFRLTHYPLPGVVVEWF